MNQREVHKHTESFARALRASLREDPDVIMVGEMRNLETISLALTAAETGHLVLGTLHTNSAASTIDRILDAFPVEEGRHRPRHGAGNAGEHRGYCQLYPRGQDLHDSRYHSDR